MGCKSGTDQGCLVFMNKYFLPQRLCFSSLKITRADTVALLFGGYAGYG